MPIGLISIRYFRLVPSADPQRIAPMRSAVRPFRSQKRASRLPKSGHCRSKSIGASRHLRFLVQCTQPDGDQTAEFERWRASMSAARGLERCSRRDPCGEAESRKPRQKRCSTSPGNAGRRRSKQTPPRTGVGLDRTGGTLNRGGTILRERA